MQSDSCAFCGTQTDRLLEIYPGIRKQDRLPFCGLCIETDACETAFLSGKKRLASLQSLSVRLLAELRVLGRKEGYLLPRATDEKRSQQLP
ncbi:MAG: hypothetical protein HKP27_01280 [Myxococcales bacterium]|nr:hypothetical protein [Myxococcales bacterium]